MNNLDECQEYYGDEKHSQYKKMYDYVSMTFSKWQKYRNEKQVNVAGTGTDGGKGSGCDSKE